MPSPGIILALVVCGGLILLLVTRWAAQRRRSVWERFSRVHRLAYHDIGGPLLVEGSIDGRPFSLRVAYASSDTGLLGIEEVVMALGLRGCLPDDLEITQGDTMLRQVHQVLDASDIETGDEDFDRWALVKGAAPDEVIGYLAPSRKEALAVLLALEDCKNAGVKDAAVFIEDRNLAEEPGQLERRLSLLRQVAPALDGN